MLNPSLRQSSEKKSTKEGTQGPHVPLATNGSPCKRPVHPLLTVTQSRAPERPQSLPPTAGQPRGHPWSRRGSKTPCHAPRLPGPACGWCLSSLASGLTALHGCPAAPSRDRLLVPPPPSSLPPPSWAALGPAAAAQPSATFAAHTTRSDPAPTTAPSKHPGLRHAPSVRPPSPPGSLPRS